MIHIMSLHGDVPTEICSAAHDVEMWAKQNGFKDWAILGVADRDYTQRLEQKLLEKETEFRNLAAAHVRLQQQQR